MGRFSVFSQCRFRAVKAPGLSSNICRCTVKLRSFFFRCGCFTGVTNKRLEGPLLNPIYNPTVYFTPITTRPCWGPFMPLTKLPTQLQTRILLFSKLSLTPFHYGGKMAMVEWGKVARCRKGVGEPWTYRTRSEGQRRNVLLGQSV